MQRNNIDDLYFKIKQKLAKGSGNNDNTPYVKGVKERLNFLDNLYTKLLVHLEKNMIPLINSKSPQLGNFAVLALLAECLECGNCGETASLAFMESLKAEHNGPIEVIYLATSNSIFASNHYVLVLNRDKEKDNINNIYNWSPNCIIVDGWQNFVYRYANPTINLSDMLYDILGKKRDLLISSQIRIENPQEYLTNNCNYFLNLLKEIKEYILSDKFINDLEKDATHLIDINLSLIQNKLLEIIDNNVSFYQNIVDYNNTLLYLFPRLNDSKNASNNSIGDEQKVFPNFNFDVD